MMSQKPNKICVVAILKDEEPFLDEWLLYHRMLGVDHFFLYDDDPDFPLEGFLRPHAAYVTVINWYGRDALIAGDSWNQIKAYNDALGKYILNYQWVTFIDADEFVVLRQRECLKTFLLGYEDCGAVSLNWHVFGHNGYYDNPQGPITASLTRRMRRPSHNVKTFIRPEAIAYINNPHIFGVKYGYGAHVDANKRPFTWDVYPDRTEVAHINHYQCRSFKNWMGRAKRGDVNFKAESAPPEQIWRLNEELCFKQFVTTVALNKNEYVDEYMLKYQPFLEESMKGIVR